MELFKRKNKKGVKLYCFSPEVMLATFVIEFALATFTFIKYHTTKFGRAAFFTLVFLGLFQLSEFQICAGNLTLIWSQVGLFSITMLPVLGIYMISLLDKRTWLLYLGYVMAVGFGLYFILVPKPIEGAFCGGNYVIFSGPERLFKFYGYYYFGFLLLAIWESFHRMMSDPKHQILKKILFWFIIGYLSFILPLTLVYLLLAGTRIAVASIMCGFAVIFAVILALKIVPLYHKMHPSGDGKIIKGEKK